MKIVAKTLAAAIVMCLLSVMTSGIATQFAPVPDSDASEAEVLTKLFLVSAANAAVLIYTLLRCNGHGLRLVGLVFLLHFGISAFMSQNETLYFNASLTIPMAVVASVVAAYAVTAALFAPFAVWLFGRMQPGSDAPGLGISDRALLWKGLSIVALLYPALYFLFGYFVLWQIPEARMLYQGSEDLLPFAQHMAGVLRDDSWLLPWQGLRGVMWILLAVPVMRLSRASWWETGIMVGLLFALLLNGQLLIPNPYMPASVRLGHFIETATSNFVLGFCIVGILKPEKGRTRA